MTEPASSLIDNTPRGNQKDQESCDQRTAVDEGVPVDVLSTNALTETSDSEVGYFGEPPKAVRKILSNKQPRT